MNEKDKFDSETCENETYSILPFIPQLIFFCLNCFLVLPEAYRALFLQWKWCSPHTRYPSLFFLRAGSFSRRMGSQNCSSGKPKTSFRLDSRSLLLRNLWFSGIHNILECSPKSSYPQKQTRYCGPMSAMQFSPPLWAVLWVLIHQDPSYFLFWRDSVHFLTLFPSKAATHMLFRKQRVGQHETA